MSLSEEIEVEVDTSSIAAFKILYNLPPDINTVVCIGGRGGAKTYEISKFIAYQSTIQKKRCVVLRDEKELVRESILNEVLLRYDTANEEKVLSNLYERMDSGIKDRITSEMMVFSKGFRASSLQKTANLKSISNIDIAVIEEAEDIRDENQFNTFADSIRKRGALIIIILNTPDIQHWIIKRFFNLEQVEDGFYEIIPKELPGFKCIKTSFEDNGFLPDHIVSRYKSYGDSESHMYNYYYYMTAILGYASTGRKGQVLRKVKPIKLADYMKLPFKEVFGLDFGTSSPAGCVGVKFDKNNCYARQLNYLPMSTLDIAKMFCRLGLSHSDKIVADSADPLSIERIKKGYRQNELQADDFTKYPRLANGFYIIPCVKGVGSVENGIGLMESMNLFAVEESKDMWSEIYNYVYARDKNGNYTNDPIDDWNHLIDPWRYVIQDHKGSGNGKLSTGKPAPSKHSY